MDSAAARPGSGDTVLEGLRFDGFDEREVVGHVLGELDRERGGWLVNPNIDVMRQVTADPAIRELVSRADVVVADGVPLLWAARVQRRPLPGLVAGSDLIWSLTRGARARGVRVFLLGGAPGVAARAAQALAEDTGRELAGSYCPPLGFERDPQQIEAIRAALRAAEAQIVFCGLGFPKQERLMDVLAPDFPATWFIGTGASISFVAGDTPRAPQWLRGTGLEWAHRLASEPRRLFKRYVVLDLPYAVRLSRRSLAVRRASAVPDR